MADYQLVVIGAGPGGYVCALRAAQLGLKVACTESWRDPAGAPVLGGTCLNVGCIPSKALLDSSHLYQHISTGAARHGIHCAPPQLDVPTMLKRKDDIVKSLTDGIAALFRKHGVDWIQGHGRLLAPGWIEVSHGDKQSRVSAEQVVIATGSIPAAIPQATVNNQNIVDSTGALEFTEVPAELGIIGAGVIGLELGSVWARLGARVTLLEALPDLLPSVDRELSAVAQKSYRNQGLNLLLGATVSAAEDNQGVTVQYRQNDAVQQTHFNKLIVAVGRHPNTSGLGAAEVGLKLDARGFIQVDTLGRTNLPGVRAIGDVTGGPMLAHKASEEGVRIADSIAGRTITPLNHDHVPWVIYTWPELAWAGSTAEALQSRGIAFRSGAFPFFASGRAMAMGETTGMVKLLSDAQTDRLLGVHIFGPSASELIAEAVLAMEYEASSEDLARTIHAHPSLSEAVHEAALAVNDQALHI